MNNFERHIDPRKAMKIGSEALRSEGIDILYVMMKKQRASNTPKDREIYGKEVIKVLTNPLNYLDKVYFSLRSGFLDTTGIYSLRDVANKNWVLIFKGDVFSFKNLLL